MWHWSLFGVPSAADPPVHQVLCVSALLFPPSDQLALSLHPSSSIDNVFNIYFDGIAWGFSKSFLERRPNKKKPFGEEREES